MSKIIDKENKEYEKKVKFFNYIKENKLICIFNNGYYIKGKKSNSNVNIKDNISGTISDFHINHPRCKGITHFECEGIKNIHFRSCDYSEKNFLKEDDIHFLAQDMKAPGVATKKMLDKLIEGTSISSKIDYSSNNPNIDWKKVVKDKLLCRFQDEYVVEMGYLEEYWYHRRKGGNKKSFRNGITNYIYSYCEIIKELYPDISKYIKKEKINKIEYVTFDSFDEFLKAAVAHKSLIKNEEFHTISCNKEDELEILNYLFRQFKFPDGTIIGKIKKDEEEAENNE